MPGSPMFQGPKWRIPREVRQKLDELSQAKDASGLYELAREYQNRNQAVFEEATRRYQEIQNSREPLRQLGTSIRKAMEQIGGELDAREPNWQHVLELLEKASDSVRKTTGIE